MDVVLSSIDAQLSSTVGKMHNYPIPCKVRRVTHVDQTATDAHNTEGVQLAKAPKMWSNPEDENPNEREAEDEGISSSPSHQRFQPLLSLLGPRGNDEGNGEPTPQEVRPFRLDPPTEDDPYGSVRQEDMYMSETKADVEHRPAVTYQPYLVPGASQEPPVHLSLLSGYQTEQIYSDRDDSMGGDDDLDLAQQLHDAIVARSFVNQTDGDEQLQGEQPQIASPDITDPRSAPNPSFPYDGSS